MPAWTALGWKSSTRGASSDAPGSAPSSPQPTPATPSTMAASDATTLFMCAPRYPDSLAPMAHLTDEHPITGELLAFVEIPKGSRNKYEYDEGIGEVVLAGFLWSST